MRWLVGLVVAISFLAALPVPWASAQSTTSQRTILSDGDADLCDDADQDDDGIVNCGSADGSEQRPYLIAGWTIEVESLAAGLDSPVCAPEDARPSCLQS